MDRDNRWERIEQAYRLLTDGHADYTATSAESGLRDAYQRGETDEFVAATSVPVNGNAITLQDGDAAIFLNFRSDRARELTRAFTDAEFTDIAAPAAFPPTDLTDTLGEVVAKRGLTQLRIAETEKYPHVTFFFSGGNEAEYEGEERILVPSPRDVKTYDEKPEMSAYEITDKLVEAIDSGRFDLMVCNYANGDMVGHTGDFDAAVKAIETVDICVGRVVEAIERAGGACLITADHGNAEQMVHPETGAPQTAHTTFVVPLVYVGERAAQLEDGRLCDLAPTLLTMMNQPQPEAMTGTPLLRFE